MAANAAAMSLSTVLKPYPAEATLRIRSNSLALFFLLLLTQLLPVPSLFTASRVAFRVFRKDGILIRGPESGFSWKEEYGKVYVGGETSLGVYEIFCMIESTIFLIISFNILQSAIALRFPRKPPPPSRSVPPTPQARMSTASPAARDKKKKLFEALSPQSSPQRPFRTPNGASTLSPLGQSTATFSRSGGPPGMDGLQASGTGLGLGAVSMATPTKSPMSFSLPSGPELNSSLNSSFGSSAFGTPSPVLTAYKWRHMNGVGRALDAPFLSRLTADDADDEDEDEEMTMRSISDRRKFSGTGTDGLGGRS